FHCLHCTRVRSLFFVKMRSTPPSGPGGAWITAKPWRRKASPIRVSNSRQLRARRLLASELPSKRRRTKNFLISAANQIARQPPPTIGANILDIPASTAPGWYGSDKKAGSTNRKKE